MKIELTWRERVPVTATVEIDEDELREWAAPHNITDEVIAEFLEAGPERGVTNGEPIDSIRVIA